MKIGTQRKLDIKTEIKINSEELDSIIILGDFNEDIRGKFLDHWREELEQKDIMLDTVGVENAPRTHARESTPI